MQKINFEITFRITLEHHKMKYKEWTEKNQQFDAKKLFTKKQKDTCLPNWESKRLHAKLQQNFCHPVVHHYA